MSQRKNRKMKKAKRSATQTGPQPVQFDPGLKSQILAYQNLMAGARMSLGVPQDWGINRTCTAFVPPPKMPEAPKKAKPEKKKE